MKAIPDRSHREQGMTVIELLFVLAVISILAMIAISLYPGYIDKAETVQGHYTNHKAITDERLRDAGID